MSETQYKWFQCKAAFFAIDPQTGKEVKMNPTYLVDAFSVTDAEATLTEMLTQIVRDNTFVIKSCTGVKYIEVLNNENFDDWYKCKVSFMAIDENSGKEKKISDYMLVKGGNCHDALKEVEACLNSGCFEYEVLSVQKSPIHEVSKYFLDAKV